MTTKTALIVPTGLSDLEVIRSITSRIPERVILSSRLRVIKTTLRRWLWLRTQFGWQDDQGCDGQTDFQTRRVWHRKTQLNDIHARLGINARATKMTEMSRLVNEDLGDEQGLMNTHGIREERRETSIYEDDSVNEEI